MGNTPKKWYQTKTFYIVCIALFVFFIIGSLAEKTPSSDIKLSDDSQKNTAVSKSWQTVTEFSGTGMKNTDTFKISGEKFKAIYNYQGSGNFIVFAYEPGDNIFSCAISNSIDSVSDESICYKSGEFYLDVNSMSGNWTIEIQEYK